MFWEIPEEQIMLALGLAHKTLKGEKSNLWSSIAKGGQRHLDRTGIASSSDFSPFYFHEVRCFVTFETNFCNLFTIGELIIQQGSKGVQ